MPLSLSPTAVADIRDSYTWYESQRPGLGEEFLRAVITAAVQIAQTPGLHAAIHQTTRRTPLRRFPYGLFYRATDDLVLVFACMHAGRDPNQWMRREP